MRVSPHLVELWAMFPACEEYKYVPESLRHPWSFRPGPHEVCVDFAGMPLLDTLGR